MTIRSFVRRNGRITHSQQQALKQLWEHYVLPEGEKINWPEAFARPQAQRHVEIGFGMGENLLSMAAAHPEHDYLGIEVYNPGVGRVLAQAKQAELDNVKVCCEDAVRVLNEHLDDQSLDALYIYFPDPWPKKKHHKRRLVQTEFLSLVAEKMRSGGILRLATDWEDYAEHMREVLETHAAFTNLAESSFAERAPERPLTKFEKRGQRLGHGVWDFHYQRS